MSLTTVGIRKRLCLCALAGTVAFAASAFCFDGATIAFFDFKDGSPGESVSAAANAIADSPVAGGEIGNSPVTRLSSDFPGGYLFDGLCHRENLLTGACQSLCLGSGTWSNASCGEIRWRDAGKALSACHASGYTLEFFFRMNPGDGWRKWDYQVRIDAGYKKADGGAACPVNVGILYGESSKTFRAACSSWTEGPYTGDAINVAGKVPGFTSFADGKWHHFAAVGKPAGEDVLLEFFIDYVKMSSILLDHAVVRAEANGGSYVMIGYDRAWASAIAGVRMSSRPRAPAEMLHAGNLPTLSSDTVAFFSLKDVEGGTSAAGTGIVRNDVDLSAFPGRVSIDANGVNAFVRFDASGPNRYVFDGVRTRDSKPLVESPGSLHFSSDSTGMSGMLELLGLGTRLSELHGTGSTLEYFIRYEDARAASWDPCLLYEAGYRVDSADKDFRVYMPLATGATFSRSLYCSFGAQDAQGAVKASADLPFDFLTDGKWHHVAVVETPVSSGRASMSVWVDYRQYSSIEADAAQISDSKAVQFCRHRLHARYSCIRVKSRPLAADEFLHASARLPAGLMLIVR